MVEHMNELRERTNTAIHSFKVDDFDLSERDDDDAHHDVQLDAIFAYHAPGAFVAPPAVPSNAADANALLSRKLKSLIQGSLPVFNELSKNTLRSEKMSDDCYFLYLLVVYGHRVS